MWGHTHPTPGSRREGHGRSHLHDNIHSTCLRTQHGEVGGAILPLIQVVGVARDLLEVACCVVQLSISPAVLQNTPSLAAGTGTPCGLWDRPSLVPRESPGNEARGRPCNRPAPAEIVSGPLSLAAYHQL